LGVDWAAARESGAAAAMTRARIRVFMVSS